MIDPATAFAVERIVIEVARFSDRLDTEAIVGRFTEDGELVLSQRTFVGRDRLTSFFGSAPTAPEGTEPSKHVITNVLVDGDGDVVATSYFQVLGHSGLQAWGRYVDEFVSVEGEWRIRRRHVMVDGHAA